MFWKRKIKPSEDAVNEAILQRIREVDLTFRAITAREPVYGPEAKPWQDRNTEKPFPEYPSQRWTHWRFTSNPLGSFNVDIPHECVGTIFPGDWIIVDGAWREVWEIITYEEEPYLTIFLPPDEPEIAPE